jgi:hypothetical protein
LAVKTPRPPPRLEQDDGDVATVRLAHAGHGGAEGDAGDGVQRCRIGFREIDRHRFSSSEDCQDSKLSFAA